MIVKFLVFAYFIISGVFCQTYWYSENTNARTTIDNWRFVVSILVRADLLRTVYEYDFHCGAVIVTRTNVLTTGWCIQMLIDREIAIQDIVIRGNTEIWNCSCGRSRDHTIEGFFVHEQFKEHTSPFSPTYYENDVGIISVMEEFDGLYEVPTTYTLGEMFWTAQTLESAVIGWGYSSKIKNGILDRLHYGKVQLYQYNMCEEYFRQKLPPNTYCITLNQRNTDGVCAYESGGLHTGFIKQFSILLGLVSSGIRCDAFPALITNISRFSSWISERTKDNSDTDIWSLR